MRALVREKYRPYHDWEILQSDGELVEGILAEIDVRGPLSSLELRIDSVWWSMLRGSA